MMTSIIADSGYNAMSTRIELLRSIVRLGFICRNMARTVWRFGFDLGNRNRITTGESVGRQ
jgi:hypothetical protein